MRPGDRVRRSDGLIALAGRDHAYRTAAAAETFELEGVEHEDIGWDVQALTRLKVNGEWGPAAAWQRVDPMEEIVALSEELGLYDWQAADVSASFAPEDVGPTLVPVAADGDVVTVRTRTRIVSITPAEEQT